MKEPERGGLKGIAGVLLSIFNEEIRQFLARKSVKFKRFGYRSREHILDYIWLLKDDLDASKSGGKTLSSTQTTPCKFSRSVFLHLRFQPHELLDATDYRNIYSLKQLNSIFQ